MVTEIRAEHESEWAAMTRVSELLGSARRRRSVSGYVRTRSTLALGQARRAGSRVRSVGLSKRENAELKHANAILKAAAAFFGAELDRPARTPPSTRASAVPPQPPTPRWR